MLVLFESSAGYVLFKADDGKLKRAGDDIHDAFEAGASDLVRLLAPQLSILRGTTLFVRLDCVCFKVKHISTRVLVRVYCIRVYCTRRGVRVVPARVELRQLGGGVCMSWLASTV